MKVALVGYPACGKTTVFNALTGLHAQVGGGRGQSNVGVVKVPDARVDKLAAIHDPKKKTLAEIHFADLVPPAKGGERGRAFDPQALAEMRLADALVHVVCAFDNPMSSDPQNPAGDVDAFQLDLVMADLDVLEKRAERLRKQGAKAAEELALIEPLIAALEHETPLRGVALDHLQLARLTGFGLLTLKPVFVLFNRPESAAGSPLDPALQAICDAKGLMGMAMSGALEMEVSQLPESERAGFLSELGIAEAGLDVFIRTAYALLDIISFLTAGPDECRAWPIRRGSTALEAAAKIHSDIAKRFIRAEVIAFDDYVACGTEARARELGKLRLEGKEYIVQDGDVVHFRHNA